MPFKHAERPSVPSRNYFSCRTFAEIYPNFGRTIHMKRKTILAASAVFFLALGTAQAEEKTVISNGTDGTTTTMTARTTYYYTDADLNDNGIIDSAEFPRYVYNRWDMDSDGFVSDVEWSTNTVRWYGPETKTYETYKHWDKNGDGRIDPEEFDTVMVTTKLYDTWDANADATIENDEYAAATFRLYDQNDDGALSMAEWKSAQ